MKTETVTYEEIEVGDIIDIGGEAVRVDSIGDDIDCVFFEVEPRGGAIFEVRIDPEMDLTRYDFA